MIEDDPTNSGPLATYLDSQPRKLSLTPPIERANVTTHQPDNHKMKPTADQFASKIRPAWDNAKNCNDGILNAIEAWESIRPTEDDGHMPGSLRAMVQEKCDTIEALRAEVATLKASLPEWIPVAERRPEPVDADNYDYVLWLTKGVIGHQKWDMAPKDDFQPTHWMSLDSVVKLPKRQAPTPEEIEQKALDAAWADFITQFSGESSTKPDKIFTAGWKAARAK